MLLVGNQGVSKEGVCILEVILVGHANTALAMKDAVEMIFGTVSHFHPLSFSPSEGFEELADKIKKVITDLDTKDILIITDLFSGTPYNASASLVINNQAKDVIAGMSLPICLEVAAQMGTKTSSEMVTYIMDHCQDYTKAFSIVNQNIEEEDDF